MAKFHSYLRAFRTMFVDHIYLPIIRVLRHPLVRQFIEQWLRHEAHKLLTA